MNKEQFLKELKEIDKKRNDLIQDYLCYNTKYVIETKFKDSNNNKFCIYDFTYDEKNKQTFYYLDCINNGNIIKMSEQLISDFINSNHWTQINNLNK